MDTTFLNFVVKSLTFYQLIMFYLIVILLMESTPTSQGIGLQYRLLSHAIFHQSPLIHSQSYVQYLHNEII